MRRVFYGLLLAMLAAAVSAEGLLSITLIWRVLEQGGSRLHLGALLGAVAVLPFALQQGFPRARAWIAARPARVFRHERRIGAALAVLGAAAYSPERAWLLYLFACIAALTTFINQQCLEALFSQMVLARRLSGSTAARTLQTATQVGSLLGATLAGLLLEHANLPATLLVYGGLTALGGLGLTGLVDRAFLPGAQETGSGEGAPAAEPPASGVWACASIIAVTAHIAAFNFLVPVLAQDTHHWSPSVFAAADAAFGVGAFGAVAILLRGGHAGLVALAAGMALASGAFAVSAQVALALAAAGTLGYCANSVRIRQREALYRAQVAAGDAHGWSSRLVLGVTTARSLTPLALSLCLARVGAPGLWTAAGLACSGIIVASVWQQARAASPAREPALS